MKILHVICSLDPEHGGPPVVASRHAASLANLGHDVTILVANEQGIAPQFTSDLVTLPGFDRVSLKIAGLEGGWRSVCLAPNVWQTLQEHTAAADVAHIHGVWGPLGLHVARACRRTKTPYVITPHGMLDPWTLTQRKWKKKAALVLAYRSMLQNAAMLHVLNEVEGQLLQPLNLDSGYVDIPNGIFLEEIDPLSESGSFRRSRPQLYARLGDSLFILFLSRLHYKKGLDYLARSFALVAQQREDVHLVVVGPDGGEKQPFENMIAQAGLMERVHVVGPIYGQEKYAALRDAACFCLPSHQEGFSVAITEALACGLPVVVSEGCHFPEVQEAGAGRVVPLEDQAIADALLDVLSDEEQRHAMGMAGAALVREHFTWPTVARQLIDLYSQVVADSNP